MTIQRILMISVMDCILNKGNVELSICKSCKYHDTIEQCTVICNYRGDIIYD